MITKDNLIKRLRRSDYFMGWVTDIKISRLIVGVSKSGKVYHYFKDVKMIRPQGLFVIEEIETIEGQVFRGKITTIWNKLEIQFFDEVIEAIECEKTKKLRDTKISKIISE